MDLEDIIRHAGEEKLSLFMETIIAYAQPSIQLVIPTRVNILHQSQLAKYSALLPHVTAIRLLGLRSLFLYRMYMYLISGLIGLHTFEISVALQEFTAMDGSWESSCYKYSQFNGAVQDEMGSEDQISEIFKLQGNSYLGLELPQININGSDIGPAGPSSGFMEINRSPELVAERDIIVSKTKHSTGIPVSERDDSTDLIPAKIGSAQGYSTTFDSRIASLSSALYPNGDKAPASFHGTNPSLWQDSDVQRAKKYKAFLSKTSMADNNLPPDGDAIYRTQMQRNNHIVAERQRREDMNEKFSILRTILPKITKKDKASIVTDTINYVRELEKKLKQLEDFKSRTSVKGFKNNYSNGIHGKLEIKLNHSPEVEIQSVGNRAVIKVTCRCNRGLLLRTVKALDDCKADVLQSNMITLDNITLQYFTVQLIPGVTATDDEIISALEEATR